MKTHPQLATAGGKIRAARENAGMKQAVLARAVGVTASHLCDIEHSRAQPSLDLIYGLAAAMDVDPGQLI